MKKMMGISGTVCQVNGKNGFGACWIYPFIVKLTMEERIFF
jgi:hypothetical protein